MWKCCFFCWDLLWEKSMIIVDKQLKYEKALEYEIFVNEEYGFAKEKIKNAKCIFDIWWHVWLFSKWCRTLNLHSKIFYFEPIDIFYYKAKTIIWNDKNIILNNFWIGSVSWNWKILYNEEKTMQSSKYSSFLNLKWIEIEVNFVSLNDYLQKNNINKIDLLKMDIEWMEFEVLSSRSDFEREKIDSFIAEIHLLNSEMKKEWEHIFLVIKHSFWKVEIVDSWYCDEIFLVYGYK